VTRASDAPPQRHGVAARRSIAAALLWLGGALGWLGSMGALGAVPAVSPDEKLAPLLAAFDRVAQPGEKAELYRDLISSVVRRVERGYALPVDLAAFARAGALPLEKLKPGAEDPAEAFKRAINAALAHLDPHSGYLDPNEQRQQRESISGSFGGLGIEVDMVDGLVRVVNPMEDTPASRAGLKSGDLIVQFDDQPVLGLTLSDAISKMRGRPGTPITLVIRRSGVADFTVPLVREEIRSRVVTWSMQDDMLHLRLSRFAANSKTEIDRAIAAATQAHAPRGVVFDMRGNPGGLLNIAVRIADDFLTQGEIVSIRGRTQGNRRNWQSDDKEQLAGVPMVVLLDGNSASAAELVAAALQDQGRAVVMGRRSYGKGSVQTLIALGQDRGALRLTTALYYSPSGRTVQRTGVGPDVELLDAPLAPVVSGEAEPVAPVARPRRREADRPTALPGFEEPPPPKARVNEAQCPLPAKSQDRALGCALAYLKARDLDRFTAALPPSPENAQAQ
jgi:carboxyl-terminal processing protease